ncbi:hypothetical protein PsB1_1472 [Candidatus Phycosocius spiralis]|uniref:Uncharacterized protein n=1 Tax=Candidatus Phycosocius spiralis TaxID=2815099 RepID=A0ABQ4PWD5_9PROT|nr:hypothetical protein PsB1_1472 [Candidatus Phycosocius spiralis]
MRRDRMMLAQAYEVTAGETIPHDRAEGATAPETLRQKDRSHTKMLESVEPIAQPPKEQALPR